MKNKNFDKLWEHYSKAESEEQQYDIMKTFMQSASLEDLLAWNRYLADKGNVAWAEHRQTGLSEADKEWYKTQFAQFDDLEKQIKGRKTA